MPSDQVRYMRDILSCPVAHRRASPSAPPSVTIILVVVTDSPQELEIVRFGPCPHLLMKDNGTMFHTVERHHLKTTVDPILALVVGEVLHPGLTNPLTNPPYLLAYEIKDIVTEGG